MITLPFSNKIVTRIFQKSFCVLQKGFSCVILVGKKIAGTLEVRRKENGS